MQRSQRHIMEMPDKTLCPIQTPDGSRQKPQYGGHGDCERTRRLYVVHSETGAHKRMIWYFKWADGSCR